MPVGEADLGAWLPGPADGLTTGVLTVRGTAGVPEIGRAHV